MVTFVLYVFYHNKNKMVIYFFLSIAKGLPFLAYYPTLEIGKASEQMSLLKYM